MENTIEKLMEHQSDFAWTFYARDFKDQGSSRYEIAKYWERRCREASKMNFKDLQLWCEENLGTTDESGYIDTDFANTYIKDEFVAFNKRLLAAAVAYNSSSELEAAKNHVVHRYGIIHADKSLFLLINSYTPTQADSLVDYVKCNYKNLIATRLNRPCDNHEPDCTMVRIQRRAA